MFAGPWYAMNTTSESLLQRVRRPDEVEAWGRFVRIYSPILYGWARQRGLPEADAADLVQDVFTALVQKLPEFSYDSQRSFRSWLWTVMRNRLVQLRRRKVPALAAPGVLHQVADREAETASEAEFRQYMIARLIPTMRHHFQPTTWQAFWAVAVEGKTVQQAAAELDLSTDVVYKARVRVLARLQAEFANLYTE